MKIVIIGASIAGIACARRAREEYPNARIVIFEKKQEVTFEVQNVIRYLKYEIDFLNEGYYKTSELRKLKIEIITNSLVVEINSNEKYFNYFKAGILYEKETYDRLVMATGSTPVMPLFEGNFENLYNLKSTPDIIKLRDDVKKNKRIAIIGSGLLGVELGLIFLGQGKKVTIISKKSTILQSWVDPSPANLISEDFRQRGGEIISEAFVVTIKSRLNDYGKITNAIITDKNKKIEADVIVYAGGINPNSFLLHDQVDMLENDAILVDEYSHTSIKDIFAIGDCASTQIKNLKKPDYRGFASVAIRDGETCAINLFENKYACPPSNATYEIGYQNRIISGTGITKIQALENGIEADSISYRDYSLSSKEFLNVYLLFEKTSHQILGMQIFGSPLNVQGIMDIASIAIQGDKKIEDLEFSVFSYRPDMQDVRGIFRILAQQVRKYEHYKKFGAEHG